MHRSCLGFIGIVVTSLGFVAGGGATELTLNQVMTEGAVGYYDHHQGLVLSEGFWAQTGSDVTATINQNPGFYLDKSPLDAKDNQYTSNAGRTFLVAGCVPKNYPVKVAPSGSVWLACNDLDYVKDKVVESAFISCFDLFRNGVLQELFIKEINNRTWESFRFSCGDLTPDGTVAGPLTKADFLINFPREGTLYQTSVPTGQVSLGITEIENQLQLRQSLLSIALDHQRAQAIYDGGLKNRPADDILVTPRIPPSSPQLGKVQFWNCPPGMVLTGAAIGHNPDKKGKDTRPIYILAECRKLLHNP
ncbi:MAG TPA: hypothetical protein PLT27_08835 [Nitrospira sp.]|nr:hypothetical protein [Nitrospira sp.]